MHGATAKAKITTYGNEKRQIVARGNNNETHTVVNSIKRKILPLIIALATAGQVCLINYDVQGVRAAYRGIKPELID